MLNELVPQAGGEIVVLVDARQRFDPGALRALVAPFADPSVGMVQARWGHLNRADAALTRAASDLIAKIGGGKS